MARSLGELQGRVETMSRMIMYALFLGSALLCALLVAAVLLPTRPSPIVLKATQDFELQDGQSISVQSFSITAAGGFHGNKRGTGEAGDILVFVRDGSSPLQSAQVVVQRVAGGGRVTTVYDGAAGWSKRDAVAQRWTANGIDFIYYTLEGQGENAGQRKTFVFGTIGKDFVTFTLQCEASIWPEAFAGLAEFVATVRPTEKSR
jgi:hypothetical protein